MKYDNLLLTDTLQSEEIDFTCEKSFIVDDVFAILEDAYKNVKGGLGFKSRDELITKTSLWRVIYLNDTIVGVVIYKAKRGLKMVALGIATFLNKISTSHVKIKLITIFKNSFATSWMEVSEGVERFVLKNGGDKFVVNNTLATMFTGKEILSLNPNGYHYTREINGVVKSKLIVGTVKF